jgi:hypothetical protein
MLEKLLSGLKVLLLDFQFAWEIPLPPYQQPHSYPFATGAVENCVLNVPNMNFTFTLRYGKSKNRHIASIKLCKIYTSL